MKRIGIIFAIAIFTVTLAGCSYPYLPHNAVKYIPEFHAWEDTQTDKTTEQGGTTMKAEPLKQPQSYFSPGSIRERYAQHIQSESADNSDPLFDIARDTVQLMRHDGKDEDEIRAELKARFHFSDEIIDMLVKE